MGIFDHSSAYNKFAVGQVLMDNWVEDRQVSHLQLERDPVKLSKRGHSGLLATKNAKFDSESNSKISFRQPVAFQNEMGTKSGMRMKYLHEMAARRDVMASDKLDYSTTSRSIGSSLRVSRTVDLDLNGDFSTPITHKSVLDSKISLNVKKHSSFSTPVALKMSSG
jgi:hypothetical protein